MRKRGLIILGIVILLSACHSKRNKLLSSNDEVLRTLIKKQVDSIAHTDTTVTICNYLQSPTLVLKYYGKTDCDPIWIGMNGLSPLGDSLLYVIKNCYKEGLDSSQYHLTDIEILYSKSFSGRNYKGLNSNIAHLDILLTDAFFTYALHQYAGCIHSSTQNVEWEENVRSISVMDSLQKAIDNNQIKMVLNSFICKRPQYTALERVLRQYIDIRSKGGWVALPEDTHLKKGDTSKQVALLYKRLLITGDISEIHNNSDSVFGDSLVEAVKNYQRHHGLVASGIVEDTLIKELNKSVNERINQVELNMERWRWLPHTMPQPYIMVNIAGFNLVVIDSDKCSLSMNIIVGNPYKQTPLFNARITYVTLNPWWEIPESIATKEMLPAERKNKNYFAKNNIKVYAGWQSDASELSPADINWNSVSASNFKYRLRQTPGSGNALGTYLFMFPNKYDVYLHDTPNKNLFSEPARAFSHGCMRIEKPLELAQYLLKDNAGWSKDQILKVVSSNEQDVKIVLKKPVDIYISYWTAWVDDSGQVYFVPDIYSYDQSLNDNLHKCSIQFNRSIL
ncbi:MAG TPA: L,D-transpeptidase family protein [Bacteroidia bacterium]|nr:L,D-transpeptidase family protein [Bacteroidia bacterium]